MYRIERERGKERIDAVWEEIRGTVKERELEINGVMEVECEIRIS